MLFKNLFNFGGWLIVPLATFGFGPEFTIELVAFTLTTPYVTFHVSYQHERNFVVKCEGDNLVWNQYITKPKEKNVGDMDMISPLSKNMGGGEASPMSPA